MLIVPFAHDASAHTIDAVGEYRLEIGWVTEPVINKETNGLELFISPLEPCPDLEPLECAAQQEFADGVSGLEKAIKIQLVYDNQKIILPLVPDHNVAGKYYAFVTPTVSGFYQANLIGEIDGTTISLSMHPPKVNERAYIEFPVQSDLALQEIIESQAAIIEDLDSINDEIDKLKKTNQTEGVGYAGVGLGLGGIIIAAIALAKKR